MSRRGRGEGSLWPRKDGRWEGRVQLGWSPEGRRLYRSVIAPSQAEAVRRLADLRRQLAAGLPATDQRLTVTAYLARWLDDAAPRLRPSTLTRYAGLVRGQLVPKLGRLKLHALAPSDVARMMAAVQADGLSPRTAGHCRAVLRCALADAERDGLVGRNVARLADAPRVPAPTPTVLEPAEVWAVLDACTEPGLRRLATVAITTGLRLGEQLGLRWADVDTERRCLTVRTTLQRTAGAYSLGEPKSTASRRVVPLTDSALEALHQERQAQLAAQAESAAYAEMLAAGGSRSPAWSSPPRPARRATATRSRTRSRMPSPPRGSLGCAGTISGPRTAL